MTEYSRGDIVLLSFVFTDESGERRRPAVVVSSETFHQNRKEAIVEAITSRTDRILVGDHLINDWREAGLLYSSVATGIVRTIKQNMIAKKLGKLSAFDMRAIENNLRIILELK